MNPAIITPNNIQNMKKTNKDYLNAVCKKLFCILIFTGFNLVGSSALQAGNITWSNRVNSDPYMVGMNCNVSFETPHGSYLDQNLRDIIKLGIDQQSANYVGYYYKCVVTLDYDAYDITNNYLQGGEIELQITYSPYTNMYEFNDQSVFAFNNGTYMSVEITDVVVTDIDDNQINIPLNFYVETSITTERYYYFSNYLSTPIQDVYGDPEDIDFDGTPDELLVTWEPCLNAGTNNNVCPEEYQLEWTYVNDYNKDTSLLTYLPEDSVAFDFKNNATRITTADNEYRITLAYDHGYVLYRVRGVGRNMNDLDVPVYNVWSCIDSGNVADVSDCAYPVILPYESTKNWQYSASFAEEGKRKEIMNYADGSLRGRQSVTRISSDSTVVVGQTIYDFQGRPAINVLPSPVSLQQTTRPALKFYSEFNTNSDGNPYTADDFDKNSSSTSNITITENMNTATGSSLYYSEANADKVGFQSYVPDAEGYPFTQTEYMPDNTGKIKSQSGAGTELMHGSGHETKYLYAGANQVELDRLFGSEVGDASHYQKNAVIDPNGQASITYLDQENRTIATCLEGESGSDPGTKYPRLVNIQSEDIKHLAVDLFNKDLSGHSNTNLLKHDGDGIPYFELVYPLIITGNQTDTIEFSLSVDEFTDSCLNSVCFNCIYDLEIRLFNEDQEEMIEDSIMIGRFRKVLDHDGKDSLIFSVACAGNMDTTITHIVSLEAGNYILTKKLKINKEARDFYIEQYLDTLVNTSCLKHLSEFVEEAIANVDTSACYMTCDKCVELLGDRDEWVSSGRGTELGYDLAYEECISPCKTQTWSEAAYYAMMGDMSPYGQYGRLGFAGGVYNADTCRLSIYNRFNNLPENCGTGNVYWRTPLRKINGMNHTLYFDDDGTRSRIRLANVDFTQHTSSPQLTNDAYTANVLYDPAGGYYYSFPEYLANLTDFIEAWKTSWAKSLVQYHPEYAYYEVYQKYDAIQGSDVMSCSGFDSVLMHAKTFQDAVDLHFINSNYDQNVDNDLKVDNFTIRDLGDPTHLYDPFSGNAFFEGLGSNSLHIQIVLENMLYDNYKNVGGNYYSMIDIAAMTARCGLRYGESPSPSSACLDFGTDWFSSNPTPQEEDYNDSIRNQEWTILKNLYFSEKQKLEYILADRNLKINGKNRNACIGEDHFNPFHQDFFEFDQYWHIDFSDQSPYFDECKSCTELNYLDYRNKEKRFFKDDVIHALTPEEADYNQYEMSGQTPLAFQLQYLLNALVNRHQLTSTTPVEMLTYPEFTIGIYKELNHGTLPSTYVEFYLKSVTTSDPDSLRLCFYNSGGAVAEMSFYKANTGLSDWDSIQKFAQLSVLSSWIPSHFEIAASKSQDPSAGYYVLTGVTSFDIYNATFPEVCEPNDLAVELTNLMSALKVDEEFFSTNFQLTDYIPFIPALLQNYFPVNSLLWNYVDSTKYEIYSSYATTQRITISFSSILPSTSALGDVKYFGDVNSAHDNFFTMKGYNLSHDVVAEIEGSVFLANPSGNYALAMGDCHLPIPLTCHGDEFTLAKDLGALITNALLGDNYNLNVNTGLSNMIKSYLPHNCIISTGAISNDGVQESLTFPISDSIQSCNIILRHKYHTTGICHFQNVHSLSPLYVTGPIFNNAYTEFYFVTSYWTQYQPMEYDTIYGQSCLPLNICGNCFQDHRNCMDILDCMFPDDTVTSAFGEDTLFYIANKLCHVPNGSEITITWGDSTILTYYFTETVLKIYHHYTDTGMYNIHVYVEFPDTSMIGGCSEDMVIHIIDPGQMDILMGSLNDESSFGNFFSPPPCGTIGSDTRYELYYLTAIEAYNNSLYSAQHNFYRLTPVSEQEISDSGLCNCLIAYMNYLALYSSAPPNSNYPLPVSILEFGGCNTIVINPEPISMIDCDANYIVYLQTIANYNDFIISHPQLNMDTIPEELIYIDSIFKEKYCMCLDKYRSYLNTIIYGTTSTASWNIQHIYDRYDIATSCDAICMPDHSPTDTVFIPPYHQVGNPCVQEMLAFAVSNAYHHYNDYMDSLRTYISNRYTQHCLGAVENFYRHYPDGEFQFTLYYYDQAGNLVRTIPPEGVKMLDIQSYNDPLELDIMQDRANHTHTVFTDHEMASTYEYNSLNQLVKQNLPDHDKMSVWDLSLSEGLDQLLVVTATQFVNESKGFLCGYVDYSSYRRGLTYTTNDGGKTWTRINDIVASDLKKIQMVTTTVGYAVGNEGIVVKTADGGNSWDMLPLYTNNVTGKLNDLYFISNSQGLIVGDDGTIITTTDGGITFTVTYPTTFDNTDLQCIAYTNSSFHVFAKQHGNNNLVMAKITSSSLFGTPSWTDLIEITALNDLFKTVFVYGSNTDMFVIGNDGLMLKSTDGGYLYSVVQNNISNNFIDVHFKNDQEGVSLIEETPFHYRLWKTMDGGQSWQIMSAAGEYYNKLSFYQADKGYAVGENGIIKRVVLTNNYGLVNINSPDTTESYSAVFFEDADNGIVASKEGKIFLTFNAGDVIPEWLEVSTNCLPTGDRIAKDIVITMGTGLYLATTGKIYKIEPDGDDFFLRLFNYNPYHYANVTRCGQYFFAYNYDLDQVDYILRTSIPTANSLLSITNNGTVSNVLNLMVRYVSGSLPYKYQTCGTSGKMFMGESNTPGTTSIDWTERSQIFPLYVKDAAVLGQDHIVAVGLDGTLLETGDGYYWKLIPAGLTGNLNAISYNDQSKGLIVGDAGKCWKINSATAFSPVISAVSMPVQANLYDVAVNKTNDSSVYICGANGILLYGPDVVNFTGSSLQISNVNTANGDLRGISFIGTTKTVYVVGDHSGIYSFARATGVKIKNVYAPQLNDVHFADINNGYVVGDNGTIRRTNNGGFTWQIQLPTISPYTFHVPDIRGVFCEASGRTFIAGSNGYALKIVSGALTVISPYNSAEPAYNRVIVDADEYVHYIGQDGYYLTFPAATISYAAPAVIANGVDLINIVAIDNDKLIVVGNNKTMQLYDGTWHSLSYQSGSDTNYFDIYPTGESDGFISGNFGRIYTYHINYSGSTYTLSKTRKSITDQWIMPTPADTNKVDITTIDFPNKNDGFIAGGFNDTRVLKKYARMVHYENLAASTLFWYDKAGRLVLSQNTKQFDRKPYKAYSYTFYDEKGRIKEVGEKTDSISANLGDPTFKYIFGDYVNTYFNPNVINDNNYLQWINFGYKTRKQVTRTYYDEPMFTIPDFTQENLRNRVATITYEDADDGDPDTYNNATHYTYDIHGNVNILIQDIPELAELEQQYKKIEYEYDLVSGKVNLVKYQEGQADAFYHKYEYDADNRITRVYTSTNNIIWDMDAKYWYYKHGPLARMELGDNQVQGVDYAYTLQGWIKGVNSNWASSNSGSLRDIGKDGEINIDDNPNKNFALDVYGYTLGYFEKDYKPINSEMWSDKCRFEASTPKSDLANARSNLYNGNIGHMVTTIRTTTNYEDLDDVTVLPLGMAYNYDQLNRIVEARGFTNLADNYWENSNIRTIYNNFFTYDGNGNILAQSKANQKGGLFDQLQYQYFIGSDGRRTNNKLYLVNDTNSSTDIPGEITDQGTFDPDSVNININNTYSYDEIGNLIKDHSAEIGNITWTVSGKVKNVIRESGSSQKNLTFDYDAMGNRIAKHIYDSDGNWLSSNYYIRDAQGNIMATYSKRIDGNENMSFKRMEAIVYGSSRLGVNIDSVEMIEATVPEDYFTHRMRYKQYELTNHLGNVLTVITDCKIRINGEILGSPPYLADVVSSMDYYAFGQPLPERSFSGEKYKFGFNGKEKVDEITGTAGTDYDYGMRIYDARLGRFLSVDPLTKDYPWYTPYQFAGNKPIIATDLDGAEELLVIRWYDSGKYKGQSYVYVAPADRIVPTGYLYINADWDNATQRSQFENRGFTDPSYTMFKGAAYDKDPNGNYHFKTGTLYSQNARNKKEADRMLQYRKNFGDFMNGVVKSPVAVVDYAGKLIIPFDYDDTNPLKFDIGAYNLSGYKKYLQDNPDFNLVVEGYASNENGTGDPDYNLNLSSGRANAVKDELVRSGVNQERITSIGMGTANPIGDNNTDTGRKKNRRAELRDNVPMTNF
jgi:RHS repeat-associated protein